MMDHGQIIEALTRHIPSGLTLDDDDVDSIRYAVRTAFEFDELLTNIQSADTVTSDPKRVRTILSKALAGLDLAAPHFGLRSVAKTLLSDPKDPFEAIEYANDTIASGDEIFPDLRQLAEQMAAEDLRRPLRWRPYPSVLELKREFGDHFEVLRSPDTEPQQRIRALLNTARLQLTFFANTFCEP